jgi:hypothetical protein
LTSRKADFGSLYWTAIGSSVANDQSGRDSAGLTHDIDTGWWWAMHVSIRSPGQYALHCGIAVKGWISRGVRWWWASLASLESEESKVAIGDVSE